MFNASVATSFLSGCWLLKWFSNASHRVAITMSFSPIGPFGRRSPDQHQRERSPGSHYHKPRSPRRRSRSPRWRDRSPRRRSRSPFGRERERDRDRDRDRDRGRNRDRERDWHKDRDSDRERGRGSDRESEKRNDGIPLPKKETLSGVFNGYLLWFQLHIVMFQVIFWTREKKGLKRNNERKERNPFQGDSDQSRGEEGFTV